MRRCMLILALFACSMGASESSTSHAGVATSSRYATQAAVTILRQGGSAIDAATAAAFVLSVVRPDAAGVGGGGFLVYYDSVEEATWSIDFRETASWKPEVTPESSSKAKAPTGLSAIGTPGFVAGLKASQDRFGRSKWKDLLAPAIYLAEKGFDVDSPLTIAINTAEESKTLDATARATLLGSSRNGLSPTRIVQTDLAATLSKIARSSDDFYEGATASRIAEFMESSGGPLTIRDFREYSPVWRAPLQIDVGAYSIQTAPPPAFGGVAIASMLAILGSYDLSGAELSNPGPTHLLAEAQRRAIFDARRVVADPGYTRIAIGSILNATRAELWRTTIDPERATATPSLDEQSTHASGHTTHIAVIDTYGNIASLTVSLSGNFGSGVMVPGTGILLNRALADFAYGTAPDHPNTPEPRKRPATPLAPLIVFENGKPMLAAGASGGDAIPACLTSMLLRLTRADEALASAIDAPRIHQPDYPDRIVFEPELQETARRLEAMGHSVQPALSIGEINAVMIDGDRIVSVSDPRGKGSTGGY